LNVPFLTNSIDVVYTSHSIEPNRGSERPILEELYRVAKKFLVLFEPAYELASLEARQRMDSHGYCRGLTETALALGYDVVDHRLFPVTLNPLNPTAVTIIRKRNQTESVATTFFADPKLKTPLQKVGDVFFSPDALMVFPIIGGIPCLRPENGIIATRFADL